MLIFYLKNVWLISRGAAVFAGQKPLCWRFFIIMKYLIRIVLSHIFDANEKETGGFILLLVEVQRRLSNSWCAACSPSNLAHFCVTMLSLLCDFCVCAIMHYRDAVPWAVRPVGPGEGDVLRGPAPGEEGAGEPDVGAHQSMALPAGVNHYGLALLRHWGTQVSRMPSATLWAETELKHSNICSSLPTQKKNRL